MPVPLISCKRPHRNKRHGTQNCVTLKSQNNPVFGNTAYNDIFQPLNISSTGAETLYQTIKEFSLTVAASETFKKTSNLTANNLTAKTTTGRLQGHSIREISGAARKKCTLCPSALSAGLPEKNLSMKSKGSARLQEGCACGPSSARARRSCVSAYIFSKLSFPAARPAYEVKPLLLTM